MGVVVPVGDKVMTFIFRCDGSLKDSTWSLGYDLPGSAGLASDAMAIYAVVTDPSLGSTTGPYNDSKMTTQWSFLGVSCMEMTNTGPLTAQYLNTEDGTNGANSLPLNCAFMLNKNTAAGGRKNRGRAYLPPCFPGEAEVNAAGVIDDSAVVLMQATYNAMFDELTGAGFDLLLHHSDGSAGTTITGLSLGSVIATQRRRLR